MNMSDGNVFTHDGVLRLVWSGPDAIVFFVCFAIRYFAHLKKDSDTVTTQAMHLLKYFGFCVLFAILSWFSLFVGWGSYFSIGRSESGRAGVFDFLLGHPNYTAVTLDGPEFEWSFAHRWFRDYSGMAWRGLVWTVPSGTLLLVALGSFSGWEYMLSGVAMGLVYELAHDIPIKLDNFSQGTPLGEFLWGAWMTGAMVCNILGHYRGSLSSRHSNDMAGKDKQLINRTFTIIIVLICFVLFLISAITYSFVEQKDMRNKYQTLIGIMVSTIWLFVMMVLYGFYVLVLVPSSRRGYQRDEFDTDPYASNRSRYKEEVRALNESDNSEGSLLINTKQPAELPDEYHWAMFSLLTILIRYLSLLVFLATIITSVVSLVWFYGHYSN